jgi:hypothetical protein
VLVPKLHEQVAYKAIQALKPSGKKAYIVDDIVAQRFGKKMPGISSYFGEELKNCHMVFIGLVQYNYRLAFKKLSSVLYQE